MKCYEESQKYNPRGFTLKVNIHLKFKAMKKYVAIFETNEEIISETTFLARDLKSAKRMAGVHKRHTPEIVKHKGVRTSVRPYKSHIINLKNQMP